MRFHHCLFLSAAAAAVVTTITLSGCGGGSSNKPTNATRSAIVGVAVRASDGAPVPQTVVYARHYVCDANDNCNFSEGAGDAPRVTADKNGHFVLPLPPGRYFVGFDAPKEACTGYTDGKWADVVAERETDVSAQMTETPTCPN